MNLVLAAVALILACVCLVRSRGESLTDWAVLCLAISVGALAVFRL